MTEPGEHRRVQLRHLFERSKILGHVDLPMLSVYRERGVVMKDEAVNPNKTAEDRSIYQLLEPGWLAVNRMKAWQGSLGISPIRGIVSGHYICFRPTHSEDDRFLHHLLRSPAYTARFGAISRGVRPGQIEIDNDELASTVVTLPRLAEQRRIANFLDDQVSRIDSVISARRVQTALAESAFDRLVLDAIGGRHIEGARRQSGMRWLGSVPESWPVLPVSSQFETVLGKMLDDRQQTGEHPLPYLRNTNVQWDRVDTDDLKVMDIAPTEYDRYTVRAGDLLICEGGQPGRAAIWHGAIATIGFQKALHRARTRGRSQARWLLHCLRAAVAINAFAGENGVTTIGHLTGEQLRAQRFPFPEPGVQARLVSELDDAMMRRDRLTLGLARSSVLLGEYKQSLITAAVTGELDVTTASERSFPA